MFSDYGLAMQAAIAGQGMVLASWPTFQDAFKANLLVRPFAEVLTADLGYDIVRTPEADQRPEAQAFIGWILQEAQSNKIELP